MGFGNYVAGLSGQQFSWLTPMVIVAAAALTVSSAHAQNLIQDPYFARGLPQSGSTDSAGNTYSPINATASTFDGLTGITLSGANFGLFFVNPLGNYDTNGVNYVFTFLAAAVNPDAPSPVFAQFAYTTDLSTTASLGPTPTGFGLTQYTVTGTSSGLNGNTGYFYVQAFGGGDVFVTGLDLEPAPVPVTGSGTLSFGVVLAGLAAHRLRRRKPA